MMKFNSLKYREVKEEKQNKFTSCKTIALLLLQATVPATLLWASYRMNCDVPNGCAASDIVVVSEQVNVIVVRNSVGNKNQL